MTEDLCGGLDAQVCLHRQRWSVLQNVSHLPGGRKSASPTVDGSEIPRPTTWHVWNPINNGILTISTGEFTGFLNHQQYGKWIWTFPSAPKYPVKLGCLGTQNSLQNYWSRQFRIRWNAGRIGSIPSLIHAMKWDARRKTEHSKIWDIHGYIDIQGFIYLKFFV